MDHLLVPSDGSRPLLDRLRGEGYVYLPGLLPDEVAEVRGDVLNIAHEVGLTVDPASEEARPGLRGRLAPAWFAEVYPRLQRLESFHRLGHAAPLVRSVDEIFREPVFCHAAKVCRVVLPTTEDIPYGTEPHQDLVKLHVASDVLTAWISLSDCDERRQGIRVLVGSHRDGFLAVDSELGRSLPVYLRVDVDDPRWVTAPFRRGDVVLFHSLTVHSGGPNTTDQLRLSVDVRFQRVSDPMLAEHARPHGWPAVPDWPDLVKGWTSTRWCATPPEVQLVSGVFGDGFAEKLQKLTAPPSRLLDGLSADTSTSDQTVKPRDAH